MRQSNRRVMVTHFCAMERNFAAMDFKQLLFRNPKSKGVLGQGSVPGRTRMAGAVQVKVCYCLSRLIFNASS
jgi:hypothetical protein